MAQHLDTVGVGRPLERGCECNLRGITEKTQGGDSRFDVILRGYLNVLSHKYSTHQPPSKNPASTPTINHHSVQPCESVRKFQGDEYDSTRSVFQGSETG